MFSLASLWWANYVYPSVFKLSWFQMQSRLLCRSTVSKWSLPLFALLISAPAAAQKNAAFDETSLPAHVKASRDRLCRIKGADESLSPIVETVSVLANDPDDFERKEDNQLVLLPCDMTLYNYSYIGYLVKPLTHAPEKKDWVMLHALEFTAKSLQPSPYFPAPSFDQSSQTLRTMHKSRGIGDCGQLARYEVTPEGVALVGAWSKECEDKPPEKLTPLEDKKAYQIFPKTP
ncbi:MAG: DUF1176 domain-containing protein [Rickettsiales bacterium]|nr:DUF1176 domain-containing protein [Rickettsiales bacterium]